MNTPTIKYILGDRILIRRKALKSPGAIFELSNNTDREPPFFAKVVAVGTAPSENIFVGDTVILAAPPSQDRVGTRKVLWKGEPCELVSTLDVVGRVEP